MKTIDLVLKAEWYDMIASGEKREEYREIKPYWCRKIMTQRGFKCPNKFSYGFSQSSFPQFMCRRTGTACIQPNSSGFSHVRFRRGYTTETMMFKVESVIIGRGKPEWGAPDYDVFIIRLGERV